MSLHQSTVMKRRATYDDLLEVPDTKVAELVDGELFVSPRPAPRLALAKSVLSAELGRRFDLARDGPGGWWILHEPELHFGDDVLVPDVSGWRRERLPRLPDAAALTLAPDWVCEVISPLTERLDRARKLRVYAREGVANAWLVNPASQTLEVYRRFDGAWLLVATCEGAARVRAEPFEAIELELAGLWGEAAPEPQTEPPSPSP